MSYPVPIIGTIDVTDPRDTYPTHSSNLGYGGIHHVATIEERDAITTDRRVAGMLCTVQQDGVTYQLASDLATWFPFTGSASPALKVFFGKSDDGKFLFQCQQGQVIRIDVMIITPFSVGSEIEISPFFSSSEVNAQTVGIFYGEDAVCLATQDVSLSITGSPVDGQGVVIIGVK